LLHHPGKDRERGPRGSFALYGAADSVVEIAREGNADTRTMVARKSRDGPEGAIGAFKLRPVTVGQTADGDAITACVIARTDLQGVTTSPTQAQARPTRLSPAARVALDALRHVTDKLGKHPPEDAQISAGVARVVLVKEWRACAYRKGISTSEEPRAQQKAFERATAVLQAAGRVAIWDDYAWPVG